VAISEEDGLSSGEAEAWQAASSSAAAAALST
jgi:hypothetical protein